MLGGGVGSKSVKAFGGQVDFLAWLVLDATSDDWESLVQIQDHVARHLREYSRPDLAEIVVRFVEEGLFKIADEREFALADLENEPDTFWFKMTEPGRAMWSSHEAEYRFPFSTQETP